jgi:hypothetical protein
MRSTGPKWGCAVLNAPRGSWFHPHNAKNDKIKSAIAQVNACGGRSLSFVMHGMLNGCGRGAGMMPSMSIWTG